MAESKEKKAFKDWFDAEAAGRLGAQIRAVMPSFPVAMFEERSLREIGAMEFHDRVNQFAGALRVCLPLEVPAALEILRRSLPPVNESEEAITSGWLQWPVGHFIAAYGLEAFDESFETMIALTQRFSSEFAVRPFVERHPEKTFAVLRELTSHPSSHVRRWCSEGVRPRLPWGKRLVALCADPSPLWPILEALKDDDSAYVRKSVANCLNDIGKDHPGALLDRMGAWAEKASPERKWIIRHALRTLIKEGHPQALELMGYSADPPVRVVLRVSPTTIRMGEAAELTAELSNESPVTQNLLVDFAVGFPGKNGGRRDKVFKWTTLELAADETRKLRKKLTVFKPTSVRALYPGEHRIELQLNGTRQGGAVLQVRFHAS